MSKRDRLCLFLAQGFGTGRTPVSPGTAGSAAGLIWFFLLLLPGRWDFFACGALAGVGLSIWLCGQAETLLGVADPSSVVIDEITAVPLCFLAWMIAVQMDAGAFPGWLYFLERNRLPGLLAIFLAFRFFDILKPWPIGPSQNLPGGWGVTADDCLAAAAVNLSHLAAFWLLNDH